MDIISKLNYTYGLNYYGLKDVSTNWELSFLSDNKDLITEHFKSYKYIGINSMDDYIDYLWLSKMVRLRETLPFLTNTDDLPNLKVIIDNLDKILSKFGIRDINKFLSKKYVSIFEFESDKHFAHDMKMKAIEYIYKHSTSFSDDCFSYIEEKYWHVIVDSFENYINFYKKKPERFKLNILSEKIALENIKNYDRVFKLLRVCKRKPFEEYLKNVVSEMSRNVLLLAKEINIDNYLEVTAYVENAKSIAILYRVKEAYEFDLIESNLQKVSSEYFDKRGHKFTSEPVNLTKAVQELKDNVNPDLVNFMTFSHTYDAKDKMFKSIYDNTMTSASSLVDHVTNVGLQSDDYFSASRLQHLKMSFELYTHYIYACLIDEEMIDRIVTNYHGVISNLVIKNILTDDDVEEYLGMCSLLSSLITMKDDTLVKKSLSYSVSMLIVAYIEKLLRKIYISKMSKESYIDVNSLSLNALLNTLELKNYLGEHFVNVLGYKLSYKKNTKIGENIRNILMHNSNSIFKKMNIGYPSLMLYILISILNCVSVDYITIPET